LAEALTTYGKIGVKVWICKGEVYGKRDLSPNIGGTGASSSGKGGRPEGTASFGGRGNERGGERGGERRSDRKPGGDRRGGPGQGGPGHGGGGNRGGGQGNRPGGQGGGNRPGGGSRPGGPGKR
jgi:small subunit ribosomal protein S3